MSRGVNKADEYALYLSGMSTPEVSRETGIPVSTLFFRFKKAGILRGRSDAVRLAFAQGKVPSRKGEKREFTPEWRENISTGKLKEGEKNSLGVAEKPNGYSEITRGRRKGQLVHRVVMSEWIGRELLPNECVHHIDGDKSNNDINNLALMTAPAHMRLHRREDQLAGKTRRRNQDGTWS